MLLIKVISKLCSGTINFIAEYFFLCKMSAHVGSLSLTNQLSEPISNPRLVCRGTSYDFIWETYLHETVNHSLIVCGGPFFTLCLIQFERIAFILC